MEPLAESPSVMKMELSRRGSSSSFLSAFLVVQVDAAVAQLTVVQVGFLGTLTGYLRDAGNGLAFFFGFLDFLQQDFGHIGMLVEVVVYLLFYEIAHKLVDADARQRIGVASESFSGAIDSEPNLIWSGFRT